MRTQYTISFVITNNICITRGDQFQFIIVNCQCRRECVDEEICVDFHNFKSGEKKKIKTRSEIQIIIN